MCIFPTKILLATDGSEDAELAATVAMDLSKRSGAELNVVRAWTEPTPIMSVAYSDFERLIEPTIAHFAEPRTHDPSLGMGQVERRWATAVAGKRMKGQAVIDLEAGE